MPQQAEDVKEDFEIGQSMAFAASTKTFSFVLQETNEVFPRESRFSQQ
jgi:hypothetical protein